jgi:EAL domain-containing protein (putative c-di-GMP-specific phosphodiesterase class I)
LIATIVDPCQPLPEARILILAPEGKFGALIEETLRHLGARHSILATTLAAATSTLRRQSIDIIVAQVDSEFSDGLRLPSILKDFHDTSSTRIPNVFWIVCNATTVPSQAKSACESSSDNPANKHGTFCSASLIALESLAHLARAAGVPVSIASNTGAAGLRIAIGQLLEAPRAEPPQDPPSAERMPTEDDVVGALTSGEGMRVVFQPQFELHGKTMVGAEALVRWRHAKLGDVAPANLLPIVNRLGLDLLLFSFIERQAIETLRRLHDAGIDIHLAINASPRTLCAPGLAERLALKMRRAGLPTHRLILELTEESTDFDVLQLSASIAALRTRGFQLSLDDFGSGSATLALLSHTPFDELKIDGSLVRACLSAPRSCRVIASIVELARVMDMRLVAEGIEDMSAIDMLLRLGCRVGQGYALARPLEAAEFLRSALSPRTVAPPISA